MTETIIRGIMEKIPEYFDGEKAKGIDAAVQCIFTGKQASNWVVVIDNQDCEVKEGRIENPDITIKADGDVGVRLFLGELDPMRAYLLRKVKISGDLALGMKLVKLFDRP